MECTIILTEGTEENGENVKIAGEHGISGIRNRTSLL
jgi:hypothetical protein